MDFEWDEEKREAIWREREVDLLTAALVFADANRLDAPDRRAPYGELRRRVLGVVNGVADLVVYTMRGDTCRLITAWRVNDAGYKRYQARLARRPESDA
jgi:uncharacterized DUF497 family protein